MKTITGILIYIVLPNIILYLFYLLNFSKYKNILNKYKLETIFWIILLTGYILYGYIEWEIKGYTEVSHFGNSIATIGGFYLSFPIILIYKTKNKKSHWILLFLVLLGIFGTLLMLFILAMTNNIWGM